MSTAQSIEHLKAMAKPAPAVQVRKDTAKFLVAALATIQALDGKTAELQTRIDQFPTLEAAIVDDRTKSPADIRAGLTALRDQASDLRIESKRLSEDRAAALAAATARFPEGQQMISAHFNALHEAMKLKALAAVAPFFVGSTAHIPHILEHLPAVEAAKTQAMWCQERVKGESYEEILCKFVETINDCGLIKPSAE